jgi:predicted nucleotidyltransferase
MTNHAPPPSPVAPALRGAGAACDFPTVQPNGGRVHVEVPQEQIEAFCRKWKIRELALFGSVLRDDFYPDSDVDVLVEFEGDDHPGYRGWLAMEEELQTLLGRDVDLVEKSSVVNPYRLRHILASHQVVYAA